MTDSTIWTLVAAGYLLTWLLIPWVLLKRTVHASAAVAWILSIIFIPFLGALLCVVAGTTRWERQSGRMRQATEYIDQRLPEWRRKFRVPPPQLGRWHSLAKLVSGLTGMGVTSGNAVKSLADTTCSLEQIEQMIRSARRWVHVEFYIWRPDSAGERIRDLLIQKAKEGLNVRLLYDGIGSLWLGRKFLRPMQKAGVQTACFTPGFSLWHLMTLNLRNHRKIVIVDGEIALTGGMNIGREYTHFTKSYGEWRDTQVVVRGPAVLQLQQVFAQDWYFATGESLTGEEFYPEPQSCGDVAAQVVVDGPDDDEDTIYSLLAAALGQAERCVTLSTPYFVPPEGLAVSLETAARRGIRVRLMTANRGNFIWTHQAGRSYYDALLRAGVEIWEYNRGLYHPKVVVVDDEWSLVGTPNLDYRSLILNFEVAVASFDKGVAAELENEFEHDLQFATRINREEWQQRSKLTRLHEQFWRLIAPIL